MASTTSILVVDFPRSQFSQLSKVYMRSDDGNRARVNLASHDKG